MSDILFEGLLQKPGRIPGRKTKVWSVLSGKELLFYRENKRSSCIGSLELSLVRKVEKVVSDGNEFRVDHDGNLHIYAAEDSVKCDEWVTHILEAVLQAVQTGGYNKHVPLGQNTEKFKVEASRKADRADDKKNSIQSKIKSFLPSGNKQKSALQTREQTTIVKKDSQGEEQEELCRSKDERQNSLSKPSVKKPVTLFKKQKSVESHFTKSTPPPRKECTNDSVTSPQEFARRDSEVNQTESEYSVCVLPIKTSQEKISAYNKHEVSGTFKSFQDTDRNSSSSCTTGKDTRPDSGYETLAGSENRRSVITEDYGEIDISQVVLRKSRHSINSLTMSNSENEVPKDEPVPVSKEIQDTNQEQDSLYENHINDTKRDDSKQNSATNEHLQTDLTVESIRNHENEDAVKREQRGKGPCDKRTDAAPVPMRRSRVNKRSTLIDVNVPRVVVEDEEDDEKSDDTKEMSLDGDILTEEQEEMLVNLTFDPIDEIPYKSDDMDKDDFSEIREIVKHRNTRTRNSFIPDNNPVEKLRELLQQL